MSRHILYVNHLHLADCSAVPQSVHTHIGRNDSSDFRCLAARFSSWEKKKDETERDQLVVCK